MSHPLSPPSERTLLSVVGFIFLAVAVLHLMRIVYDWKVVIDDFMVPSWVSWIGFIVAAYLSYSSFARRSHR